MFSDSDKRRIAESIAKAERMTSGEILAVVASESSSYLYVPLLWAGLIALLVPWPLIFLSWHLVWVPVYGIYLIQLLVYALVATIAFLPPVRFALVPASVKKAQAHRRGVEQFLAQNLHTTAGRTGVLIFVSIAERYAEIIADKEIYQHVPKDRWQAIVDELTRHIGGGRAADGFISAIEACGRILAQHFPPGSSNPDELPNHLIVLD